jgi:hypothetical protein
MTRASVPRLRVPRPPFSRPNTSATGRPERPDPCTDPPTVTINPTRVMPVLPDGSVVGDPGAHRDGPDEASAVAATVPRLRSVTSAGGGALGDGRVLAVGSALGAVGGLACWVLAARTWAPAELGRVVAVVALVAVAGCAARPDRGAALVHRLPAAGRRAGRVVVRSLAAAVALGAGAGAVLGLLVPGPAATLSELSAGRGGGTGWLGVFLVAAAAAAWAVGGVHAGVVVALDRPGWAVAHVGVLVASRAALLGAAAILLGGQASAAGLAAAWLVPVLLWALPGSVAVAVLARRHARRAAAVPPPQVLGPTALARFGATLLHHVPPLLVVLGAGPAPGMLFFVAWQAVTAADLVAVWVLGRPAGASRRRLLVTVGPGLLVTAVLAGPLLALFGPGYAAAADVLRVLLLGAVFRLVVVHELGAREAAGRAWSSARLHLCTTVPTLLAVGGAVVAVALAGHPAVPAPDLAAGLLPVVIAYALVQVACAGAVLVSRPVEGVP